LWSCWKQKGRNIVCKPRAVGLALLDLDAVVPNQLFFLNPLDHYAAAIAAPQLILHKKKCSKLNQVTLDIWNSAERFSSKTSIISLT
jgi:hypothetical protein